MALLLMVLDASSVLAQPGSRLDPETAPPPSGDEEESDDQSEPGVVRAQGGGFVILPGISYSPERGFTLAVAALRYFRLGDPNAPPSRIRVVGAISVSGQGSFIVEPEVRLLDDRLRLYQKTKFSYYEYDYFGIGNDAPTSAREEYIAARLEMRFEGIYEVVEHLYVGPLVDFRGENITEVEPGGELDMDLVRGSGGGRVLGAGALLRWDSRNHSFWPTAGSLITVSPRFYHSVIGSAFDFNRYLFEASHFIGLGEHVLAIDGQIDLRTGQPPFDHLSQGGGSSLLRGMLEGRYRDMHFIGAQVEYRSPLWLWERLGFVAFAGTGRVANQIRDFGLTGLKPSLGGGVRFALKRSERINLRLDAAWSEDDTNFYLNLLEAF